MSKQEWRQVFLLPGKNIKQTSHCKSRIHTPSKQLLFPTINKEGQALGCILEHKTKSNPSTLVIKAVTKLYKTWHHNEKLYTSAENEEPAAHCGHHFGGLSGLRDQKKH